MPESIANKAVKGTVWSATGRFGVMGLQFIINLVLARLLTPDDFGAIGMLLIFVMVSQTCVDGGFGAALIQKKETSESDYSTIFLWSVGLGCVLYLAIYAAAPYIAHYYHMQVLCPVLRTIGVILIFSGMASVQIARLQKMLRFKEIALADIGSYILSGAAATTLALKGFGIWSLVAMMIMQTIGKVLMLYFVTRWIPKLTFSFTVFKQLFAFGGYLFISNLLESVANNVQGIIIGRNFSAAQMGYYTQASKLENVTGYSIPQVIATVMYPVFSQYQDNKPKLRSLISTDLRVLSFIIYPLLTSLIIFAPEIIHLLFGEKWFASIPYYRILCTGAFFFCLNNINYYAVAAVGKSRALFFAGFYKWGMLGLLLALGLRFGMTGLVWSLSVNMLNIFLTNAILSWKYTGQPLSAVFAALIPSTALCALSAASCGAILLFTPLWWPFALVVFVIVYIVTAKIFNIRAFDESLAILSKLLSKHK